MVLIAWVVMPTQEKHMQKFIKYLTCFILLAYYIPFVIVGFLFTEAKEGFMNGVEFSKYAGKKFENWIGDDRT